MSLIDWDIYQAGVSTYTDRFYVFIPWLRLNGIRYIIEETDLYENGLVIKIFHGETKQERKLINYYINVEFPKIRDRFYRR